MDKRKCLSVCVVCLGLAVISVPLVNGPRASAGQAQAQEESKPLTSQHSETSIKALWRQMARLHSQIVAIEMNDKADRAASVEPGREALEPTSEGADRPNQERGTFRGSDATTEQLWMQLAQVHKQIVVQEAGSGQGQTVFFRGEPGQPERAAGERNQETDREPTSLASQTNVSNKPLWERYVQLQQQIVAADIKKTQDSSSSAKLPAPPRGGQ